MALTVDDFADVQSALWGARHKWFDIGILLQLKVPDLKAIDLEPELDLESKFKKMILSWLERGQRCTWRALRKALEHHTVNLPQLAQQIKTNYGSDESGDESADDGAVHDSIITDVTSKEIATSTDLKVCEESSEQQKSLHLMLYEDSQKMAAQFSRLTSKTEVFIIKENIPVKRLVACISPLSDDTYKSVPLIADHLDTAEDVSRVFIILKRKGMISFINYKIMVPIINNLCKNEELTEELKSYETHFREYVKRRVCEVSAFKSGKFQPGEMASPAEGDHLLIITDPSWSAQRSFKELLDLKLIIATIFKINDFALDLHSVESGIPTMPREPYREDETPHPVEQKGSAAGQS